MKKQRGLALLEMALYMILASTIIIGSWAKWQDGVEEDLRITIAGEMTTLSKSVIIYANKYKAQIKAGQTITSIATATAPTVSELATLNVGLPSTFTANPLLDNGYKISVTYIGGTLDDVRTLVYTAKPIQNSSGVADKLWAILIANKIGSKGVYSNNYPDFLYAVGGATIYPNPAIDPVTSHGYAAIVGIVDTLSSNNALTYWKEPVISFASLPLCDINSLWHTRIVQNPTVGTGPRAYTCDGAGVWKALGVDDTGNFTVAGTTSTGKLLPTDVTAVGDTCDATTEKGKLSKDTDGNPLFCQSGTYKQVANSLANESTNYELRYRLTAAGNVPTVADTTNLITNTTINDNFSTTRMNDSFVINRAYTKLGQLNFAADTQLVWHAGPNVTAGPGAVQDLSRWGAVESGNSIRSSGTASYNGSNYRIPAVAPYITGNSYMGDPCLAISPVANRRFITMQKIPAGHASSINATLSAGGKPVLDSAGNPQISFSILQITIDGNICSQSSSSGGALGWRAAESISCTARMDDTVDHVVAMCVEQPAAMTAGAGAPFGSGAVDASLREKEYFYINGNINALK